MTIALGQEYARLRMKELGYERKYFMRFKHYVLQAGEVRSISAHRQYFILVEEPENFSVESDMGIFDLNYANANELIYEHQGKITLTNFSDTINRARFIQLIPKNVLKKDKCNK